MLNGNAAGAETVPSRLRAKSPFFTESEPNNLTNEGLSSPVFVKLLFQRLHSLSWLLLIPTCVLLRSSPTGGKIEKWQRMENALHPPPPNCVKSWPEDGQVSTQVPANVCNKPTKPLTETEKCNPHPNWTKRPSLTGGCKHRP